MTTARKYNVEALFKGVPKKSDFKIVEETLPAIKDGGKHAACLTTYCTCWPACRCCTCICYVLYHR